VTGSANDNNGPVTMAAHLRRTLCSGAALDNEFLLNSYRRTTNVLGREASAIRTGTDTSHPLDSSNPYPFSVCLNGYLRRSTVTSRRGAHSLGPDCSSAE